VAVIAGGDLAWAQGYGVRQAGQSAPITAQTLFQAASISKPVAAVAVMRLVQEGRLDLDEDVHAYLRSWQVPANGDWQPRVTLRQLLSHTAGTTIHGFPGYHRAHALPTLRQVLDGVAPANTGPIWVNTVPGGQFRYSGGGTSIVQQLLMDVTGQPFPALMRELVLAPLGMEHSTYEQPLPRERWPEAASGHRYGGGRVAGDWHVYPEMAAAGLWTTPTDLARLALEVQAVYAGRPGKVLTRPSVEAMLVAQARGPVGIGFFVEGEEAQRRFGHGGSNEGFKCQLLAYVEQGLGAAIMTNGDPGWQVGAEMMGAIAREYSWPLGPKEQIGFLVPPRQPAADDGSRDEYAGDYSLRPDFPLRVARTAAGLTLHLPGQPALALLPLSETEYYAEALDMEVTFHREEDGTVRNLVVHQNGSALEAKRQ
jgi:CubicO group peptidase (beta-lactamase class C family)